MSQETKAAPVSLGENISAVETEKTIIITIKKDERNDTGKPKTLRVASTLGNKEFGGIMFGINAYVYRNSK